MNSYQRSMNMVFHTATFTTLPGDSDKKLHEAGKGLLENAQWAARCASLSEMF